MQETDFRRAAANDFLAQSVVNITRELSHNGLQTDSSLYAHLFAFDSRTERLTCLRLTTAPTIDIVHESTFRWGRDIVGTAFRRHETVVFSRANLQAGELVLVDGVPPPVEALCAIPLIPVGRHTWPVGVFVLSSQSSPSSLSTLRTDQGLRDRVSNPVYSVWKGALANILN